MADIAFVFGWTPRAMGDWSLDELAHWQALAIERWNSANRTDR